jgi:hypothetical protein
MPASDSAAGCSAVFPSAPALAIAVAYLIPRSRRRQRRANGYSSTSTTFSRHRDDGYQGLTARDEVEAASSTTGSARSSVGIGLMDRWRRIRTSPLRYQGIYSQTVNGPPRQSVLSQAGGNLLCAARDEFCESSNLGQCNCPSSHGKLS